MTDPIMQPSPLPQQKKGMSKGCLISLIVVGIIGVVIIALGIVCYVYKDEIIAAGLSKMTEGLGNAIIENLPEGVTEDEVRTLMDDFTAAFKEGKINETEMQELSQRFQKIATKDTLSQEEAKDIMEFIKNIIDE